MAIALYRKYRPNTFDKVVGQEHVTTTLINQIKSGNISHAYLFTGTRGSGKTSTAKIFAKAINCISPVNGSPCLKCEVCKMLDDGANMDVIEIDAASNNGVDEIRDLREKIKFPPTNCRYKVYIIDEVHMLTTSAFNALLKTLEEPPAHAVFILATTEVQALPQTILSRCMRFDFKSVTKEVLSNHLKNVLKDNGTKFDEESIELIAESGNGSFRDTLSVADMCVSYCNNDITYDKVLDVLGIGDPRVIIDLCDSVLSGDIARSMNLVNDLIASGKTVKLIAKEMAETLRNSILVNNSKSEDVVKLEIPRADKLAVFKKYPNWKVLRVLDIIGSMDGELRYNASPRIVFETALLKCMELKADIDIGGLVNRIKQLEGEIEELKKND
mgnify:FL=1